MFKHYILLGLFVCLFLIACQDEEDKAWQQTISQNSSTAIDSFLVLYPNSKYISDAATIKEDFIWFAAKEKNTVYNYKKYLVDYPTGKYKDEVPSRLDSINTKGINMADLTKSTFVGKIDYGNRETQVLAFRFLEINEDSAGVRFLAQINTSDIRKTIQGKIDASNFLITFTENTAEKVMLNITDGRAYIRGNKIVLESTNVNQYWNLIKYNEE